MRKIQSLLKRFQIFFLCLFSFAAGAVTILIIQNPPAGLAQSASLKPLALISKILVFSEAREETGETPADEVETMLGTTAESSTEVDPIISDDQSKPFWEAPHTQLGQGSLESSFFEVVLIDPEESPHITEATPDLVLSDFQGRISSEFEIPELIFNQTKFWFRVYTEFDSTKKIIHDSLHPHIIYDVIDISDILAQPTRARWLNVAKADKYVSQQVAAIRKKLQRMARKNPKQMDDEELQWLAQLDGIKGNRRKIIQTAAKSLRVQTGQKDFYENGLRTSGRYLDGMESIFRDKGLPIELTRLPFVESSFVIGATSKVGAAGIWQFMPNTGRIFMQVNDRIDERRNPWKATQAAAKLLKENYTILHKQWGLALTAYNHGPSGVRRAMKAVGSKDIAKIVKAYRSKNFDFASANFYTCFLAALYAHAYRDILWPDHIYEPSLAFEELKLTKSYKPRDLTTRTGLSHEELLLYNPELDRSFAKNYSVPKGFRLLLPAEAKLALQGGLNSREGSLVR